MSILFYSHKDNEYGYLSNFYGIDQDSNWQLKLLINGKTYNFVNSESAYQIYKFMLPSKELNDSKSAFQNEYIEIMCYVVNPNDVAAMGRQKLTQKSSIIKFVKDTPDWIAKKFSNSTVDDIINLYKNNGVITRKDWDNVKDNAMFYVVQHKFKQNPHLAQKLIETADKILIEHTKNDNYWVDGGDGTGKNKLGLVLMQVRSELSSKNKEEKSENKSK